MADIGKLSVVLAAQGAPMVKDARKAAKDASDAMKKELAKPKPVELSGFTEWTSTIGNFLNPLAIATGAVLGLGATMAGLVAGTFQAAFAMDELGDTAERIGVDVNALTSLGYAAEIAGTDMATLTGSLQIFTRNLGQALNGSQEMNAAFERLGLDARELANMPIDAAMLEVAGALQNVGTQAERTAALTRLFGRQGAALGPLFARGTEGIQELTDRAAALGITFDQDTGAAVGELTDLLTDLQRIGTGAFQQVAAEVARELVPALRDVVSLAVMVGRGVAATARDSIAALKSIGDAVLGLTIAFQESLANTFDSLAGFVRDPWVNRLLNFAAGGVIGVALSPIDVSSQAESLERFADGARRSINLIQRLRESLQETFRVPNANWASAILDPLRGVQEMVDGWTSGARSDAERLAELIEKQKDVQQRQTPALERGSAAAIEATSRFNVQIERDRTPQEILETARQTLEQERIQAERQQEMIDLLAAALVSGQLAPPPAPI